MITMKPTEKLTGITIKGDYHDFYDLVDSIYRITTEEEDIIDPYYGVKLMLLDCAMIFAMHLWGIEKLSL
ncbi:hypothetical protein HMPREF9709_01505 [Helcococcus kunzii ATCC 51366]|uniref:Uncharacterized protein n=1 Tax=Helcococcus kunzii ATCC 51366 TaxID=883114 RepID=H3NQ94_9FIRM|nr:hypothetical protein [Helcococcus kunzii]EHR32574.1 hypothetical protein HMPREF9709_01505 [Helcococcus kunzii ATCC 51366]